LQTVQDDLLICEERGILEAPLIALAQEDPKKVIAFIKGYAMLSETELIYDNENPIFIRFYSHLLVTLSRNIAALSSNQEIIACLDTQLRTTEQTTY
jgi:transcriptional regulatory protein LevR